MAEEEPSEVEHGAVLLSIVCMEVEQFDSEAVRPGFVSGEAEWRKVAE